MGKAALKVLTDWKNILPIRLLVVSTSGKTDAIALSPSVIASAVPVWGSSRYSKGNVSLGHHGLKQGS